jgi:hypothetical protein
MVFPAMKNTNALSVLIAGLLIAGCASEGKKFIFHPPDSAYEQTFDHTVIIESQNGPAGAPLPEWTVRYLQGGIPDVESMDNYSDKYVFIGENRGNNFNAMRQWALHYSAEQDLPRLAATRIEKRMYAQASLYPDDEYGDFFEALVKNAANEVYLNAQREESFWIKQQIEEPEQTENPTVREAYVFFVLISADKAIMQKQIRDIMGNIKTAPTRDQSAAINRLRQNFFEGF